MKGEKTMKKVIALLAAFVLVLGLAACSGGSSSDTVGEEPSSAESAASSEHNASGEGYGNTLVV